MLSYFICPIIPLVQPKHHNILHLSASCSSFLIKHLWHLFLHSPSTDFDSRRLELWSTWQPAWTTPMYLAHQNYMDSRPGALHLPELLEPRSLPRMTRRLRRHQVEIKRFISRRQTPRPRLPRTPLPAAKNSTPRTSISRHHSQKSIADSKASRNKPNSLSSGRARHGTKQLANTDNLRSTSYRLKLQR